MVKIKRKKLYPAFLFPFSIYATVFNEAVPGVLGKRGILSFISGEHGNMSKNEGNR